MGYFNSEDKTREAIDSEGWYHTGDLGRIDSDGYLFITGRIKELIITAGGENVAPVPIEDRIKKELPFVSNALVIGDRQLHLSVLLTLKVDPDPKTLQPTDQLTSQVQRELRLHGIMATTVTQLLGNADWTRSLENVIKAGIERANEGAVSNVARVKKWRVLEQEFSIQGEELGPTLKVRRPVIVKKYEDMIERLYKDSAHQSSR
jgi:long-chain-fatty-acid--CoA ligase ACSBG